MKRKYFLLTLVLLLLVNTSLGQTAESDLSLKQLDTLRKINAQDVPEGAPGVAAGVVIDGHVVFKDYRGYSDVDKKLDLDGKTRFNIASNGKQFTALALLLLEQEGKVKLEDDFRKYFPEILPGIKEKITIGHLLDHTSGIRDVYALWSLQGITWWRQTLSNKDALKLLNQQRAVNFKPGSQFMYSNSNYILLAELVTRVTGKSFQSFTDAMFRDLGMNDTRFESDHSSIKDPIAKPYFNFNKWQGYEWKSDLHGDGSLFSTLEDQMAWERNVQLPESNKRFGKLIERSQHLLSDRTDEYGFGLKFGSFKGEKLSYHEGATGAWKAITYRFPQRNISIITLTNSGKITPEMQTRQMADIILGKNKVRRSFLTEPARKGAEVIEADILGNYTDENGFLFRIKGSNDTLLLERFGRNDITLVRESSNVFAQTNDRRFKLEFKKNKKEEMTVTAYYTSHAPYTLTRKRVRVTNSLTNALEGTYANDETDALIKLTHNERDRFTVNARNRELVGYMVSDSRILISGFSISFTRNDNGEISELFVDSNRLRRVRFERLKKK